MSVIDACLLAADGEVAQEIDIGAQKCHPLTTYTFEVKGGERGTGDSMTLPSASICVLENLTRKLLCIWQAMDEGLLFIMSVALP